MASASRSRAAVSAAKELAGESSDQKADATNQQKGDGDSRLQQHPGARRDRLARRQKPVLLRLHIADAAADFLHQLETLVAVDDGERRVVVAGLVRIDCGAQLGELVLDELAKLRQIFDLLRIVARQILCALQDAGQLI